MKKIAVVLSLLIILCACGEKERGALVVSNNDEMNARYCVGRVKFSLPKEWHPRPSVHATFEIENVGDDGDNIELLTIENFSDQRFQEQIVARTAEIKSLSDEDTDVLELKQATGPGEVLFRVKRIGTSYSSELHKLINGVYLRISTDSFNGAFSAAERRLYDFVRTIREKNGGPSDDGFCLGTTLMAGKYAGESVRMEFENSMHTDALLSFDISTYRPDEAQSLFDRVSGSDSLLTKFGVDTGVIRKRELRLAGMYAQEWMSRMPATDGEKSKKLLFAIESRRAKPGRLQPSIHVEFETGRRARDGAKQESSFLESEAVHLWDQFVASLSVG